MSSDADAVLTISAVAERTKVGVAVLRAWEQRYGFPRPTRVTSGHRRYSERDVEQIRRVVRERDAGLSLEAAIERVRSAQPEPDRSVFAGVRRQRPDLVPHLLAKPAMLAISRAIEDEAVALAERPVLIAAFQRERFYRASEARYRDLARTARATVVLAEFARSRDTGGPVEIAVPHHAPVLREWAVVCDTPGGGACLAGWERPGQQHLPDHQRLFEALWTVDPAIVRTAARIGADIARHHEPHLPGVAALADHHLADHPAADPTTALARATALTNRIVAYLHAPPRGTPGSRHPSPTEPLGDGASRDPRAGR